MHETGEPAARPPELLAPAGSFDCALAAFAAGADAVYLGLSAFSARAEAVNFSLDELRLLTAYAHSLPPASPLPGAPAKRRVYVAMNTLLTDGELPRAAEILAELADIGPDAVIVQDMGLARMAKRCFPELVLHASTQLAIHNPAGAAAMRAAGFARVVPARELTLDEIRTICREDIEVEVFAHGALCYSISGLCLFSAMECGRSGNRGRCAYCCRMQCTGADGEKSLPFSMRDLRLDGLVRELAAAGVDSLKIEGRMKSPLYVASAASRYRHILDGTTGGPSLEDLETVFSRRTTSLYVEGADRPPETVLDGESLGHLGARIGTLKRATKDREGRTWLRFRTSRALELHDGLQFLRPGAASRPFGMAVAAIRTALSRKPAFAVPAETDVEILVPDEKLRELRNSGDSPLTEGSSVYCSASNAVKRAFHVPSFRPSATEAGIPVDVSVSIESGGMEARCAEYGVFVSVPGALQAALTPGKTPDAVRKAFARTGGTGWLVRNIEISNPHSLFAPPAMLNALRRELTGALATAAAERREKRAAAALQDCLSHGTDDAAQNNIPRYCAGTSLKIRLDQIRGADFDGFDEIVVAAGHANAGAISATLAAGDAPPRGKIRLALPAWTRHAAFPALRETVRRLVADGFAKWEAADFAGLSILRAECVRDITADWTLYAFNASAAAALSEAGVSAFMVSPENPPENLAALSGLSAPAPVFLQEISVPLFISATRPGTGAGEVRSSAGREYKIRKIDGLWITSRPGRSRFTPPPRTPRTRIDLSWD